jgi:hypothetical protein
MKMENKIKTNKCCKKTVKVIKHVKIVIYDTKLDGDPLFIRGRVERDDSGSVSLYIENQANISNSIFSLLREACLDAIGGYSEFMCPSLEGRVTQDNGELQIHLKLVEEYKELKLTK